MINTKILIGVVAGAVFLFGAWLVYWNPADFVTQGLDYGIWDVSIIIGGLPSIIVGSIICVISAYYGTKMLFSR